MALASSCNSQGTGAVFDRHFVSRHANSTSATSSSSSWPEATSRSVTRSEDASQHDHPSVHSSEDEDPTNAYVTSPRAAPLAVDALGGGNDAAAAVALPPLPEGCNVRTGKRCRLPDGEHMLATH